MDDLISRKAVLGIINRHRCDSSRIEENILDLPIYDVSKVVEQLEYHRGENIRISKFRGNSECKKIGHICRADEDDYVIRLVKGAVKDE